MKILGLTGGIGSGKSTVARIFKTLGVAVYNSDRRAKELYFISEIKSKVETLLGKKAYKNGKALDKKYIRDKIFSDKKLLEELNAIIHPAVRKDFEDFKKQHEKDIYIVKESALLFEAGIAKAVDKILVVSTTPELRKMRLAKRDNLSENEIEQIIEKQMPDKEKIKKADWVIENNEEKLLIPQVIKIHQGFLN
ncbi:MAG TPA: dephospho-CoA kinase [Bacteroidia bacterium]|jgi:dephospho-CoA kinase|nr:dephospho-CoA kinase [Bacteroidia bacterium]